MKLKRFLPFLVFIGAGVLFAGVVSASSILGGFQGGTGYGSASSTSNGYCLTVASTSPFLTYSFSPCSSGGGLASTTPFTIGDLAVVSSSGALSTIPTSTYYLSTNPSAYLAGVTASTPLSGSGTVGSPLIFTNPGYVTSSTGLTYFFPATSTVFQTALGFTPINASTSATSTWVLTSNGTNWIASAPTGSASSSQVLWTETASGTVNGVNTTFTVQYTPIFIEVSGQVMENGNGYSLSGLTITFTNPPTQTPTAFYSGSGGVGFLTGYNVSCVSGCTVSTTTTSAAITVTGGGGGGLASTTPFTIGDLAVVSSSGALSTIPTSTYYLSTNPSSFISTSTNLTTANFASANISQWNNNSGYITTSTNNFGGLTNASITATAPITWSAGSVIGLSIPLASTYGGTATTTALGTNAFSSIAFVPQTTQVNSGGILSGGGALSSNQTISLSTTTLNTNVAALGFVTSTTSGVTSFNTQTGTATYSVICASGCTATTSTTSTAITVTGGSGSPGGSNTQLQYNNGGAFGGIPDVSYTSSTDVLSVGATTTFSSLATSSALYTNGSSTLTASGPLTFYGTPQPLSLGEPFSANSVHLFGPYPISQPVQGNTLGYDVYTADTTSTDLYDIGLYQNIGGTFTLVADIGPTALTVVGSNQSASTTQGMVTLYPGNYYMGITGNAGIAKLGMGNNIYGQYNNVASVATTGGQLPSTLTPPAPGQSLIEYPLWALHQ